MTNEEAHRRAREQGPSRLLYAMVRGVVVAFMRVWFRLSITGAEHIPAEGAGDRHAQPQELLGLVLHRRRHPAAAAVHGQVRAVRERQGPLLVALGAFPVRRGASDADALETARVILRQGGLLSLFPEGTRVREPTALGEPRRGAARLALETGAPLVPAAITGTDRLFLGPIPKPKRVRCPSAQPIPVHELEPTPEAAAELLDEQLWPEVETQFRGLLSRRGAIAAGLAALGLGGAAVAASADGAARGGRLPAVAAQALGRLPGCAGGADAARGWLAAEEGEVRLALAAQHERVHLHAGDPARLGEHPRLRLDLRRGEHAPAGRRSPARRPAARGSG